MRQEEISDVFRRFGPMVYRRARALLGNDEEAKDMMQDVFIKAMAEPQILAADAETHAWLYRVTTNACLNRIRDKKRRAELRQQHLPTDVERGGRAEDRMMARQLLAEAEADWSQAAVLVHVDGMSYDEASRVLGVSKRTVSNLLLRFRTFATARLSEAD